MADKLMIPFSLFTGMLRHRLARTINMDVNVIDPTKVSEIPNFSNVLGRFVGYFVATPMGKPAFILLGRSEANDPSGDIDHVFVYHVNHAVSSIQQSDRLLLDKKIPTNARWRKMNILTDMFSEVTVLFTVLEHEIHPRLFRVEWMDNNIKVSSHIPRMLPRPREPPACNNHLNDPTAKRIWDMFLNKGLTLVSFDVANPLNNIFVDFHVMRIKYLGHFFYAIHYQDRNALMIMIPHVEFFKEPADYKELLDVLIQSMCGHKFSYIGITRFVGEHQDCSGSIIAKACMLSLLFPQITIRLPEIQFMLTDEHLESLFTSTGAISPQASQVSSQQSSIIDVGGPPSQYLSQASTEIYIDIYPLAKDYLKLVQ
jgi:hypothetical protein